MFFSVDDDIDREAWNNVVLPWLRGINSVIGVQRTGIYGGIRPCQWATADGVIGRSGTPGKVWAWQTRSWSNGQIYPAAVLYHRIIDTASNPGPVVGGIVVVESVYGWPGIGQLAWQAIQRVDIPIIMGVTLVSACAIVIGNLIADLVAPLIDPRIKLR